MLTRSALITGGSFLFAAAAFANPIEQDQESDIPQPVVAGSGIGVPRASGLPMPLGAMLESAAAEFIAEMVKRGKLDPRQSVDAIEPRMTLAPSSVLTFDRRNEGGAPYFRDDYSTYQLTNYSNPPTTFIELDGQVNPIGYLFAADPWIGVANDAVMRNIEPGGPGGIPPVGLLTSTGQAPGEYLALARASGQDQITTAFALAMNYLYYTVVPTPQQPIIVTDDWYIQSDETSQWWSPVSYLEGCVMDRVFFGGTRLGGALGSFENEDEILDRFVSLGVLEGNPSIGQFYAAPRDPNFPFPVQRWFQISETLSVSSAGRVGRGLWIKTPDSIANGFLDPRMANGDLTPSDLDPTGWVNIHPGIEDDPMTAMREGIGLARNSAGQRPPTNGHLGLSTLLAMISTSGNQIGEGNDPVNEPGFQPMDAFIDNTTVIGTPYVRNYVVADHVIPLHEGFDVYEPNEVFRLSNYWWSDSLLTNALTTPTPGGVGNALAQTHSFGRDVPLGGNAFDPQLEGLRTRPVVGDPLVITTRLRFDPSDASMTRTVRIEGVGSILFGAVDPTAPTPTPDGLIWVRQPNPSFNHDEEWQDHLVQAHWAPTQMWSIPPFDAPLNTQTVRVPTHVAFPVNQFFDLRVEVEPDLVDEAAPPTMRVFIDDQELFPNGDAASNFSADGLEATLVSFDPVSQDAFNDDVLYIDDVVVDAPLRSAIDGPAFSLPYVEAFSFYTPHETIDEYGATPYLSMASVPDGPPHHGRRMLTVIADAGAIPDEGELVCRYAVDTTFLSSGLLADDDVIAISYEALPAPFNTIDANNLDCPGNQSVDRSFVIREAPNTPRLETGRWALVDTNPAPFAASSGDVVGYRYDWYNEPRWSAADAVDSVTVRPIADALGLEGAINDQVLEIRSIRGIDGDIQDYPMYTALTSILPAAQAHPPHDFPNPESAASLSFDLFIESVDLTGAPDDALAPRSRFSVPLLGLGAGGGRITTIMFGGPHVNQQSDFDIGEPLFDVVAPDEISVAVSSGVSSPDVMFESTGVSLLTGGVGMDGSITGPLVNRWFTVIARVNADSAWSVAIDEDRDGPLPPVTIATGIALDLGLLTPFATVYHTTGFDGFFVNSGWDLGSGGEPLPRTARIVTLPGEEAATAPPNADPFNDYCFYSTTQRVNVDPMNPPLIAEPDETSGEIEEVRPLEPFDDVIAVLNRRTDGAGMVMGPMIHERCPFDVATGVQQFEILDAQSGQSRALGRWELMERTGISTINNPKPAGGIANIDGPAQDPPIAYNEPSLAPNDYPAVPQARPILLATWADDEHDGWDPAPPVFPQQRWLIDNVRLEEIQLAPPCPDLGGDPSIIDGTDLAQLLASWGRAAPATPADLNGDGQVNGADLATLLANWGSCSDR